MKKTTTTILAAILGVTALFPMASCGKDPIANDANTIEYQLKEGGYGLEWFEQATAKFKELHPEVNFVKTKKASNYGEAKTLLSAGPDVTTCDLFMGSEPVMEYALYGGSLLKGYDCVLEDLTDVYEATVDGVKVKDKLIKGYVDSYALTENGTTKYYAYPWISGVLGIVYNATQFEQMNITVPRTTDELFDVACTTIKNNGKVPFVDSKAVSYVDFLTRVWSNQYSTVEGQEKGYEGKVWDEDAGKYVYSEEAFKGKDVFYVADAREKMTGVRYGNMHDNVNTMTFTQAQAQLLLGEGLMYVCGDWLENEMKAQKGNGDTLKYMKTPILSGIIDNTPSITDDVTLRAVVDYVDGVTTTAPAGVTEEDIAYIRQAREIEYLTVFQSAYIPSYASAKGMAKEFLKFLASDEIVELCLDTTGGSSVPVKYDMKADTTRWNALSPFMQSKYELLENAQMTADPRKSRLQVFGSLKLNSTGIASNYTAYASKNPADRNTAEEFYQDRLSFFTRAKLDAALQNAGLL